MPIIRRRSVIQACPGMWGAAASGGAPAWQETGGSISIQSIGFTSNTATFSNVTTVPGLVILGVGHDQDAVEVTGVTMDAVGMTKAVGADTGTSIWYGTTSATDVDFVITCDLLFDKIGIIAGVLTDVTATPTDTDAVNFGYNPDPHSVGLTIPSGGFGLVMAHFLNDSGTPSWSNATAVRLQQGSGLSVAMGVTSTVGAQTPGVSGFNFIGGTVCGAAWGA